MEEAAEQSQDFLKTSRVQEKRSIDSPSTVNTEINYKKEDGKYTDACVRVETKYGNAHLVQIWQFDENGKLKTVNVGKYLKPDPKDWNAYNKERAVYHVDLIRKPDGTWRQDEVLKPNHALWKQEFERNVKAQTSNIPSPQSTLQPAK